MNIKEGLGNLLLVIGILLLLALSIPLGVRLAQGSSELTDTNPYPPPATPVASTPHVEVTSQPTVVYTPTINANENDWLTYEDKDAGFSISYPTNAVLSISKDMGNKYKTVNIAFIHVGTSGGYQGMVIDVIDNPNDLLPEAIVEKLYGNSPTKPSKEDIKSSLKEYKTKKVFGIKAQVPPTNTELTILVPLKNKYLILEPVHGPAASNVDPETLNLFYKVIDTLNVAP